MTKIEPGTVVAIESGVTFQQLEIDWKQAFFTLAILVSGDRLSEADSYINTMMRTPLIVKTPEYNTGSPDPMYVRRESSTGG